VTRPSDDELRDALDAAIAMDPDGESFWARTLRAFRASMDPSDLFTFSCPVFGYPVPQGRPRAFLPKGSKFPKVYDPPESRDWKRTVQAQVIDNLVGAPMAGAVELNLTFGLVKPKSVPKSRHFPEVGADWDNLGKAVVDAMNGVVYLDDSQICSAHVHKRYSLQPGVVIEARQMQPSDAPTLRPAHQELLL
jgi:Holliday junction resolvase RusA-like endonuclease